MVNPTKSNIDRIRQQAGSRKIATSRVKAIIVQYRQGRAASSCMDEIEKAMRGVK